MSYICPMKCEGDTTYPNPGNCPKCGMNLKETGEQNEIHNNEHHDKE